MQAFYVHNVPGQLTCSQAPSVLAIQSPQNITVDLMANGANVRLGSLILLRILPPGNILQLTTVEGEAILDAGTPNEVHVPAGFTTTRCLAEPDNLGIDGQANDRNVGEDCSWQPPTPLTPQEQEEIQYILGIFNRLGLNEQQQVSCPTGTTLAHVVQRGETLFRIALRYNTSVAVIAAANNITDPQRIFAGQTLVIPCGVDTGVPSIPPTGIPLLPTAGTNNIIDCSGFVATSPLDGLPYGRGTFYWDPARGASGYRLNIYNEDDRPGTLVASILADGNSTSITTDLSINAIGYGFRFSWEVQALTALGTPACVTRRVVIPRQPPPTDVPASQTPEATPPARGN
jgi:LysM repeat protein